MLIFDEELVIIVTGCRDWDKPWRVHWILDSYMSRHVVEGNCPTGGDLHARQWLANHGLPARSYTAEWKRYGRKAGHIRNGRMLWDYRNHPEVVVVGFPMAQGSGTQDCMRQALELGMTVENYGDVQL